MISEITIKVYLILTYIISLYIFLDRYYNEKNLFSIVYLFSISKFYFFIVLNFMIANYVIFAKLIIILFFGEIRISELMGVADKLKIKLFSLMSLFLTIRMNLDYTKLLMIFHVYFMYLINNLTANRGTYLLTADQNNPNFKFEKKKIFCIYLFIFFLNYVSYLMLAQSLKDIDFSLYGAFFFNIFKDIPKTTELIMISYLTSEIIKLQINNYKKFIKYSVEITEFSLGKHWENKKLFYLSFSMLTQAFKMNTDLNMFVLIIKSGTIPVYQFIDSLLAFWKFVKNILKLYEYFNLRNLVNKLEVYEAEEDEELVHQCICLEYVKTGKKLPCGHVYHDNCVK